VKAAGADPVLGATLGVLLETVIAQPESLVVVNIIGEVHRFRVSEGS
jgi:hypothetical protein